MTGAARSCPVCCGPLPGGAAPVAGLVFALPARMGPVVTALAEGRAMSSADLADLVNAAPGRAGPVSGKVMSVMICQSRAALARLGWQITSSGGRGAAWRMARLPGCVAVPVPAVARGAVSCPCCGGGVVGGEAAAEVPVAALRRQLTPLLARTVDALALRNGARLRDLVGIVYASCPDGGPLTAEQSLAITRWRGRAVMAALGWQIVIAFKGPAARWVLLPLRPQAVR